MKPLIISMYDYTGLMLEPWRQAGYPCLIIDGQHPEGLTADPERPGLFKAGMWLARNRPVVLSIRDLINVLSDITDTPLQVGAVFGFPPCDDMAVSGARWFASKLAADPDCQKRAVNQARLVADVGMFFNVPWMAENPVSVLATMWRQADFYFDPSEYGGYLPRDDVHPMYPDFIAPRDAYPKKTGIWCGNGFTKPKPRPVKREPGKSAQYRLLGGKSLRTKNIRSATPRGFAEAVFRTLNHKMNWDL